MEKIARIQFNKSSPAEMGIAKGEVTGLSIGINAYETECTAFINLENTARQPLLQADS
jgi:hypothetical protein